MEVARLLLEKGADVEAKDIDEKTLLHGPALNGNWEFLQLLLDNKAHFEGNFKRENTTLHEAELNGNWEAIAWFLLENGEDGTPLRCTRLQLKATI